jgi:sugar (pentulose or hexulose) kinase
MTTLLAIDAGTTSTRALAFDLTGTIIGPPHR